MVVFGLLSSAFDAATFAVLAWGFRTDRDTFRTGWFVESVVSAAVVVLVVRSRAPVWASRPAPLLVATTAAVVAVTIALPYSPLGGLLGFTPLPPAILAAMLGLVAFYAVAAEAVKRRFHGRFASAGQGAGV